jgi:1-acyl-sn-glycerol-3-phosphate acyltransferase
VSAAAPEPWLPVWGRRALTIPGYLAAAAVYWAGLPAWLALALAADVALDRANRLARSRTVLMFAIYLACEVAGIACALGIGLVTFGGRWIGARRYLATNAAIQRWWTGALFFGAVRVFSMKVAAEGLELARRGPCLFFVRHTSTADTVLTAAVVANPNRLLLRYVLKRELLWDPCLDLVGRRLPNAFVSRGTKRGADEVRAVSSLAEGLDEASAVLIYPEGTRFSEPKRARAVAALEERGQHALAAKAALFRHVLPPRLGGPLALLDRAGDVDVAFVEHTGFEGAESLGSLWRGGLIGRTVRVRIRRFSPREIPREDREGWLFDRWAELDTWVAAQLQPSAEAVP